MGRPTLPDQTPSRQDSRPSRMPEVLTTALDLAAAGYSVLPIRADGTKAPAG